MVVEAADRYARLTAFIAAEQGLTCQKLNDRVDRNGYASNTPHPKDVQKVVGIIRGEGEDPTLDKVVAAFERNTEDDKEMLVKAARAYGEHMWNEELSGESSGITERNLDHAIMIVSGSQGTFNDRDYPLDQPEAYVGADSQTTAQMLKKTIDPEALEHIRTRYQRSPETPLVEELNGGLRINITDTESLEIAAVKLGHHRGKPYWNSGIRRVTTKNGKRLVTASNSWGGTFSDAEALLAAANFTRPINLGWEPGGRIGFRRRVADPARPD
jgi:hypothetical protein